MTFRIDRKIADQIQMESGDKMISINNLVNRILTQYVEWGRFESKIGMVPISKQVIRALFSKLTEADLIDLAKSTGKSTIKDITIFLNNETTLDLFLNWFELRMKNSFAEIIRSVEAPDNESLTVRHDLGYKWSFYHKLILESICNEMFQYPLRVDISDSIIKLHIVRA